MRNITLLGNTERGTSYSYENIRWSLATPADKEGCINSVFTPEQCREEVVHNIRTIINDCPDKHYTADEDNILFDKTRLLAFKKPYIRYVNKSIKTASKIMLKELKFGISFVHLFETMKEWDKTIIYPVNCTNDKCSIIYNIVGPPQWVSSPHTLSLFILLLRLGSQKLLQKTVRSRKAFFRLIENFVDPKNRRYIFGKEWTHVESIYKHWFDFINNFEVIFDGRRPEYNYGIEWVPLDEAEGEEFSTESRLREFLVGNTYGEGITTLIKGKSKDKELAARIKKYIR